VRYEDLLAQPEQECAAVASRFGLDRVTTAFELVHQRVRNMGDKERPRDPAEYVRDEAFDPAPYEAREFDAQFSKRERRAVHDGLDADVCRRLGYGR
jgi:hypothetical protein